MATRQAKRRQQRVAQRRGGRSKAATTPWYFGPWGLGIAVVAIAVVVVLIVVSSRNSKTAGGQFISKPAPPSILSALTNPPQSTLAKVGGGGMTNVFTPIKGHPRLLRSGGKPVVFYDGAEFCPFCAGERWGLINALSRFGTFSNLHLMKSISTDVYPNTNTFTFLHSHYSSKYISFVAKEFEDRKGHALQTLTNRENAIVTKYDRTPYTSGIPFIDLGNRAIATVNVDSAQLHVTPNQQYSAPLTWGQITGQLSNPSSSVARTVLGNGNWLTAGICRLTGNKPASACSRAPIPKLEHKLKFHP